MTTPLAEALHVSAGTVVGEQEVTIIHLIY
jgi:hypothetical protein